MTKKFEIIAVALSELPLNMNNRALLEAYSADNNFTVSIYGAREGQENNLIETVKADLTKGMTLEFNRLINGQIIVTHTIVGDSAGASTDMNSISISNEYSHIVVIPNTEVTISFYD